MKNTIIILSFLIAGLFFASSVYADPLIQVSSSVNPTPIAPGTDGYVQLTFTNSGSSSATNIQIPSFSADPNLKVSWNGVSSLGALGTGQSKTTLIKFSVSSSAPSGLYTISFVVNICTGSCTEADQTVIVTVQSPSSLEVASIQPDTLVAGEMTTLSFNLANQGSDNINNIVLTWQTPNNEILPLGHSNRQYISSIGGGASLTIPVDVVVASSVSPGAYPLIIQLSYVDKSGVTRNINSSIGMKIGGTTDFDVAVQQYSSGTLSLSIANIGVNPATSVSVAIPQENNTNYAVTGATSAFLGTLNTGDFSVANFQISSRFARSANGTTANPNGGTARTFSNSPLVVQITYSDTSGNRQTIQKDIVFNLASTQTTTFAQRNQGLFGLSTPIWITIVIVIVVAFILLWFFKLRKKENFLSKFMKKKADKKAGKA